MKSIVKLKEATLFPVQCFPFFLFLLLWLQLSLSFSQLPWCENVLPQVAVLSGPDLHHLPTFKFVKSYGDNKTEHQSLVLFFFFLAGVQAPDKEWGGSFFGGLFPGGERWLGRWHHRCRRQAADVRRREGDKPGRSLWIPVNQHKSEVSLTNKSSPTCCSIVHVLNLVVFSLLHPADRFLSQLVYYCYFKLCLSPLKQSVGLHVWRPQWHQDEQPCGAG